MNENKKELDPKIESTFAGYKTHVFVCTNGQDRPDRCASKGSEELRSELKKTCSQSSFKDSVRINASGCLGHCEKGISVVFYPQAHWQFNVKKGDAAKLFSQIESILSK